MKITAQTIDKILRAMKAKSLSQTALADLIGVHRSYINKLLRGIFPSIPDEMVDKLNDKLGIRLNPIVFEGGKVNPTALRLTEYADKDPAFAELLETMVTLKEGEARRPVLPSIDTKYLGKVGAEIVRIVHQWEEPTGNYSPKVAVEVLNYLREFYRKGKF